MHQALLRRGRVMAAVAVAAVPLSLLAAVAPAANAANPDGSVYELFIEKGSATGNPANKLTTGFWGHEGAARDEGSYPSADLGLDGSGTALFNAFGLPADSYDKLAIAFAPSSADGSSERPAVTAGQNIGQAYPFFTEIGFGTGYTGTPTVPATDEVLKVSTLAEYTNWINDGKPDQLASSSDLVMKDVLRAGTPVSVAPKGKSILNRWASGQKISLVVVKTTGATDPATGLPIVARGADGKAVSAWLKFTTGLDPAVGTGANAGTVATSGKWTLAVDAVNTTTTLAASKPSPQVEGTPIDFTATVTQAKGTDKPTGTVQFKDGATNLGTPVVVDAAGKATLTSSNLAVGSHSITAEYIPADGAFNGSTSVALPYEITAKPDPDTTTEIAVKAPEFEFETVEATATVKVVDAVPGVVATGKVVFKEGTSTLGEATVDAAGKAVFTTENLAAGDHTITAVFVPAGKFKGSSSDASPVFNLKPKVPDAKAVGNLEARIDAGTISLSTPYTPAAPLSFGSLSLEPNAGFYVGSKSFDGITVTDTRAGARPWTLNASSSDLVSGANKINAQNVGLTDLVPVSKTGLGVISTFDNPAANAVAPTDGGSLGLAGKPKKVLSSTAGPGTVVYKGTLTIKAPTSTQAGLYTGTVTFTVS